MSKQATPPPPGDKPTSKGAARAARVAALTVADRDHRRVLPLAGPAGRARHAVDDPELQPVPHRGGLEAEIKTPGHRRAGRHELRHAVQGRRSTTRWSSPSRPGEPFLDRDEGGQA